MESWIGFFEVEPWSEMLERKRISETLTLVVKLVSFEGTQ